MAKQTRKVTQYKVFTLIRRSEKENKRIESEPVAVFDDKVIADAFVNAKGWDEGDLELQEEWTEVLPAADNFNLPFNPVVEVETKEA